MRDFQTPGRSAVFSTEGMCATSHPLAALTAVDILRQGGTAADAAVAGAVMLGLCEPQMTGIGGDCFALLSDPSTGEVTALNGSGRAPAAADPEALRAEGLTTIPPYGAQAVTVPGAIDAFCTLAERHGRLGIDALLAPAIAAAENGVPVAPRVAFDWAGDAAVLQGAARDIYAVNGTAPAPGAIFRAPGQAEVLRRIARDGRDAFYTGEVAEDMLAVLNAHGGVHTAEDFAATASMTAAPVSGRYKDVELVEHPPNGQGATAILMAHMLAEFDLASLDPLGPERTHLETEAAKLAHQERDRLIADPDHAAAAEAMLAPETARRLAARIRADAVLPPPPAPAWAEHKETVYITVVDRDRRAVSLIYSIFHGFGSGLVSERFGILLQNRGAAFTLEAGHPNELGPRKRPLHSIIPAMLRENGRVTMPFGVMGGGYQPTGHVRVMTNLIDFGINPQAALDAPRAFSEAGELRLERGYPDATRAALAELGHKVVTPARPLGGAQAIRIHEDGVLEGASDPRKDGCALGY
ncbi:gamma-glutamyltransferase family protein [Rhodosalinus sp. K401]|uniref:gamma-glutamyltransferase family protein n=1 Tax=Rhodosalinus sp. K401 TaxID=3239195 RepID=UPI00352404A2